MTAINKNKLIIATEIPEVISQKEIKDLFNFVISRYASEINFDISLAFVGKKLAREINFKHTNNNYATDVLSFNYPIGVNKNNISQTVGGEIVICTDIAQENATKYNFDLRSEIALLITHGLLHINGLDHLSSAEQTSFETIQSDILKTLKYNYRKMQWLA